MNLKSIAIVGLLLGNSIEAREFKQFPILSTNDFTHAEEITQKGESVLKVDLTESGTNKLKELNILGLGKKIRFKVGNNIYRFKLRQKIIGDKLVIGPFSKSEAQKIQREINHYH